MLSILLIGCKTKQVAIEKSRSEETTKYDHLAQFDYLEKNQVTDEINDSEIKELKQFISNLNISYDGQEISDKLDVLLQKTASGAMQLTLAGKGIVHYDESSKIHFETLKKNIKSYHDSILQVNIKNQEQFKKESFTRIDKKVKKVDNKTFTPLVWLIIGLAFVFGIFLNRMLKVF